MKDHAPAAERNRHDLLPVLREILPPAGTILEIASGTGQHAVHFAPHFPAATWQPSDIRPEALASIRAWSEDAALPNLAAPLELDVTREPWPIGRADAVLAINMLHVTPWPTNLALFTGAARILASGGPPCTYGAVFRDDRETAPSNVEFDRSLRERNPAWGVRRLEDLLPAAAHVGLTLDRVVDMPNDNVLLVLRERR